MKPIKYRYTLKAKYKDLEARTEAELVLAEISGAFTHTTDNSQITYKKFQFSLETNIVPKYFGIIKEKRGVKNYVYDKTIVNENNKYNKSFRSKIKDFETNIENANTHFKNLEPTPKEVKAYLTGIYGRDKRQPKETTTILNFVNNHIIQLESIIGKGRKDEIKNSTINSYRNIPPLIKRYNEYTNKSLSFENLNESIYWEFWDVINEIRTGNKSIPSYTLKPKPPLSQNTVKTYQTYFVKICKLAVKKGIEVNLDLTDTNLVNEASNGNTEKTLAYLNENDIKKVLEYKPTSKNLILAKDYIIIASQTGMRLQSMLEANGREIELHNENGYNFYYIHTYQEKTKTECLTPIFKHALKIIKENSNKFPNFNTITLQNLNKNIRKILTTIEVTNSKLISTHNLRSTFITNLDKIGLTETVISYVTHPAKKDRTTSVHIYIKTNMLEKAEMFADEIRRINILRAKDGKESKLYNF